MTTPPATASTSAAGRADRYVQAAKAAQIALRTEGLSETNQAALREEVETALRMARVYSELAVAEAISRTSRTYPEVDYTQADHRSEEPVDLDRVQELLSAPGLGR